MLAILLTTSQKFPPVFALQLIMDVWFLLQLLMIFLWYIYQAPNEPEAFDQVDGIIIVPLDGNPITNAQALRDVLYIFKKARTYATVDNQDVPSTWSIAPIDQGIGGSVHGIATILDSGGVNVDFLIILDYSGVMIFNGTYARPELSWKIQDYWLALDRNRFHFLETINDTLTN